LTRVYRALMASGLIAGAIAAILALPLTAGAQSPGQTTPLLELRRPHAAPRRPIVHPQTARDQTVAEAERAAAEYERVQRDEALMREQSRPAARRPDLGYDVTSGIQQRNLQRVR
jgi:hypothetical protein